MSDEELPLTVEAGPALSELMEWANRMTGDPWNSTSCNCGHEGCGPSWHLSECPWAHAMWAGKAHELARRLDERGVCGDMSPAVIGSMRYHCEMVDGHEGHHRAGETTWGPIS